MSKRKPYTVTFPQRETRNSTNLRVSGITNPFKRGETRQLMISDSEAENLRRDGWGVASVSAPGVSVELVEAAVLETEESEPKPRRLRRREE